MFRLSNNLFDIESTRGDDIIFNFVISGIGNTDVSEAVFSCKHHIYDTNYIFQCSKGDGNYIVKNSYDADTDEITYTVSIPGSYTSNLDCGTYRYDLQLTVNNSVITILKGALVLTYDITRASGETITEDMVYDDLLSEEWG